MKRVQPALCRLAAACLLCFVSLGAAHAQARIEDCEKIQAADAYNQCLAKFGPTSKVKSVEPLKPGDIKDNSAEAAAGAARGGGGTKVAKAERHAAHGRVAHGHVANGHVANGHVAKGRGRHVAATHAGKRTAKKAASGRKRMVIVVKRHK